MKGSVTISIMIPSNLTKAELERELEAFAPEFDRLMKHKQTTALMLERIFNPKKFPGFHRHLDIIHELWMIDAIGWQRQ